MTKEEVKRIIKDFRIFAAQHLKIKNKAGKIVPLILNKSQQIVLAIIERLVQLGIPVRLIVLKARQKGISTVIEAYIFWRSSFQKNKKAAIISHESDATDNMWEMQNRYYDNLPEGWQPQKKYHNAKELTYARTKSEIMFWTAEKGDVGSSHTIQYAHLTELAKWRDPKTTLTAFLQTIPDNPDTFNCIESTAKGFGGEFHDRWLLAKKAFPTAVDDVLEFVHKDEVIPEEVYALVDKWMENKKSGSNYVPIFLPWFIDDEYSLGFKDEKEKESLRLNLDEIEIELLKKGAKLEHLKWRREIGLPDKAGNSVDDFRQEYPADDIEAFLLSGRPVFDVKICKANYDRKPTYKTGNLIPIYNQTNALFRQLESKAAGYYDLKDHLLGVKFEENRNGVLKIYEDIKIKEGDKYRFAAGVDTAEGLDQGDYDVIKVLDRTNTNNGEKMFSPIVWHGHVDMDEFANEIHKLQVYLKGDIHFAIEKNNTGHAVIQSCYKLGVNLYYAEKFDKGYPVSTDTIGFRTTGTASGGGTRPEVINLLNHYIKEKYYDDPEKEFWEETLTFVYNEKGKMAAQDKLKNPGTRCYDDRIIAAALMLRCHEWLPPYRYTEPKSELPEHLRKKINKYKINNLTAMSG